MKKELILYVIFGAATTAVNIAAYSVCYNLLSVPNLGANIIAWVLSVAFACVTNRIWVFESTAKGFAAVRETAEFFAGRLFTGILDSALMFTFVDCLGYNGDYTKIAVNIIVIMLNYIISKLLVFRKK